jgi:hypothetical protein
LTIAGASSATSYSGATIYGSTAVCSAVGLFSGCVGIGKTPSFPLDVCGFAGDTITAKFSRGASECNFYISSTNNEYVNLATEGSFKFKVGVTTNCPYSSGTSAMIITSAGNVLLNNTFGGAQMVIADSAKSGNGTPFTLSSTDASNQMQLVFGRISNSYFSIQSVEQSIGYKNLVFQANGGNVGIATTTPCTKLDVYAGADATSNLVLWGQTIRNEGNGAATGYGAGLKLKISSNATPNEVYKWAGIAAVAGTGYSNRTDLAFYTNAASTVDATEKVRITGDGYVGIGVSSPLPHAEGGGGLVVKGLNNCRGIIEIWDGTSGKGVFQQVGGTTYIGNLDKGASGGSLRFLVNGSGGSATEAMVINCLGRVVINNTAAVGCGADYSRVTISGTCNKNQIPGVGGSILHLTSCENDYPFGIKFNIVGDTCNCLRSVQIQTGDHGLTNQGNVTFQHAGGGILMGTSTSSGIGVLNTYKAPVSSNYVDQIVVQGTGNYPSLRLGTYDAYDAVIATTGNDLRILSGLNVYSENHDIMFYTSFNGGTGGAQCYERMRIRYDGNVGIGTASPSAKLQVTGTIYNSATAGGGNYTLDTMGAYQSIANCGFVDFHSMSGMILVNNWLNGGVTLYLVGGGNTGALGSVIAQVGTMHHSSGVGGYRWCNNYGSTANFGFQVFRTRNTA